MEQGSESLMASAEERARVLNSLPQTGPFRFLDEITELTPESIVAHYRFRSDAWFYRGHFVGDPVTPGVILIESMAQASLVALGIFLASRESQGQKLRTLFTECQVEFSAVVRPEEKVIIKGQRLLWRRNKLRSNVEMRFEDGRLIAHGTVAGMGVEVP
ncbi:MAG: FabA/FabZ family ACP-dehydratase [Bdellovibrionota bacterium]|nr:MAG: FabA/FabZ family ACP-dehydratase [Bdellovibrionota bacterium]